MTSVVLFRKWIRVQHASKCSTCIINKYCDSILSLLVSNQIPLSTSQSYPPALKIGSEWIWLWTRTERVVKMLLWCEVLAKPCWINKWYDYERVVYNCWNWSDIWSKCFKLDFECEISQTIIELVYFVKEFTSCPYAYLEVLANYHRQWWFLKSAYV